MSETGSERERELYTWFSWAVEKEREAQKMYKVAMELATDPVLREILAGLVRDEERHEMVLLDRYQALREQMEEAGAAPEDLGSG